MSAAARRGRDSAAANRPANLLGCGGALSSARAPAATHDEPPYSKRVPDRVRDAMTFVRLESYQTNEVLIGFL